MGKALWTIVLVPALFSPLAAEITFQRTYGGDDDDWGFSIARTADGGHIVTGETGGDAWPIRTDSLGLVGVAEQQPARAEQTGSPTVMQAEELTRVDGRVLDALGQEVRPASSHFGLRTSDLSPGVYFLLPPTGDHQPPAARRIVVVR